MLDRNPERRNKLKLFEHPWVYDGTHLFINTEEGTIMLVVELAAYDDNPEFTYAYSEHNGDIYMLWTDRRHDLSGYEIQSPEQIQFEEREWDITGGYLYVFDEDMQIEYSVPFADKVVEGGFTYIWALERPDITWLIVLFTKNRVGENEG